VADRAAAVRWGGGVTFGPGVLYAPESDLLMGGAFRGALVGRRVVVGAGAELVLTRRPLACLLDEDCPVVDLDPEAGEVDRAPGVAAASLTTRVTDASGIPEALVVSDAAGQRELPLSGAGALPVPIALRPDGLPTLVCASARATAPITCRPRPAASSARRRRWTSPSSSRARGAVVRAASVRITGSIRRGSPRAVEVAGRAGWVNAGAFAVDDVPLSPGLNRLVVRVTGAQGGVSERRLLVGSGSLPAISLDVAWQAGHEGAHSVAVVRRGAAGATSSDLIEGNNVYRLLDEDGRELYRGGFVTFGPPQPVASAAVVATSSCRRSSWDEEQSQDTLTIPALDDARTIEFFRGRSWDRVGRAALAEVPSDASEPAGRCGPSAWCRARGRATTRSWRLRP
jgi:hypothetical protein